MCSSAGNACPSRRCSLPHWSELPQWQWICQTTYSSPSSGPPVSTAQEERAPNASGSHRWVSRSICEHSLHQLLLRVSIWHAPTSESISKRKVCPKFVSEQRPARPVFQRRSRVIDASSTTACRTMFTGDWCSPDADTYFLAHVCGPEGDWCGFMDLGVLETTLGQDSHLQNELQGSEIFLKQRAGKYTIYTVQLSLLSI